MHTTIEDITTTKKRIKIEVPAEALEKEIQEALVRLQRESKVPGFRQGKTPMSLVEKRYGKKIEADVLEKTLPRIYLNALKEANITPVTPPELEQEIDFRRGQPLSVALTVEIMPNLADIDYSQLKVKDMPVSAEDSEVQNVLERLRTERSTFEPSEEPAGMGDLAVIDYAEEGGDFDAKDFVLKLGETTLPDDFSQKLVGKNKGEQFSLATSFPANHLNKKLAGRKVNLNVTINDIKKKVSPEIDDEFAKDMKFEDLGALKNNIKEAVLRSKKSETEKIQKAELIKQLVATCSFDIPESLVERELENLTAQATIITSSSASGNAEEKSPESFKPELRADAIKNVKAAMLIDIIGKKEGIVVTEEDIKAAFMSMSANYSISPENLVKFYTSKQGALERLKSSLFEEKVLDFLLSKAIKEKGD